MSGDDQNTCALFKLCCQVLEDEHYTFDRLREITGLRTRRLRALLSFPGQLAAAAEPPSPSRVRPRRGLLYIWAAGSARWMCHLAPIDGPPDKRRSLCGNLPRKSRVSTSEVSVEGRSVCLMCRRSAERHWKDQGGRWVPK